MQGKDDAPVNFVESRLPNPSKGPTHQAMATLRKRSVQLSGHATSIALEPEFWTVLEAMAAVDAMSLAGLIGRIDDARAGRPLASACRVAALAFQKTHRL
jgi:predicted DNA-binding ribbon-helix-helix protein